MNNDRLPLPWTAICSLDDIVPNTGVGALVNGEQVAVFHVDNGEPDARRMAKDVDAALKVVVAVHGGMSEEKALDFKA